MKIKCLKLKSEEKNSVLNNNLTGYIEIGNEFEVFGIRVTDSTTYFTIFLDKRQLIEVPIELFEIIDSMVPDYLHAKIFNGSFCMWPNLFYKPFFFDDFSEYKSLERELFNEFLLENVKK